jgi:signal transduction histidine kinase
MYRPARHARRAANPQPAAARVAALTGDGDFTWVANLLRQRRDEILDRWFEATAAQPFHHGRRERAIADHIPPLFEALVGQMGRQAPPDVQASPLLQDPYVFEEAQAHARVRLEQGLSAAEVLLEFRLLRQEIGRALRLYLPDGAPAADVVAAALLLDDALDGAALPALAALDAREAERQRLAEERRVLDEEREAFVLTIAHDLKNPLTSIKGTAQILLR